MLTVNPVYFFACFPQEQMTPDNEMKELRRPKANLPTNLYQTMVCLHDWVIFPEQHYY